MACVVGRGRAEIVADSGWPRACQVNCLVLRPSAVEIRVYVCVATCGRPVVEYAPGYCCSVFCFAGVFFSVVDAREVVADVSFCVSS